MTKQQRRDRAAHKKRMRKLNTKPVVCWSRELNTPADVPQS